MPELRLSYILIGATIAIALSGCVATPRSLLKEAAATCAASSDEKRTDVVIAECDKTRNPNQEYIAACHASAERALESLWNGWPAALKRSAIREIVYSNGGYCIDTEIPGQELNDCIFRLKAAITLTCAR